MQLSSSACAYLRLSEANVVNRVSVNKKGDVMWRASRIERECANLRPRVEPPLASNQRRLMSIWRELLLWNAGKYPRINQYADCKSNGQSRARQAPIIFHV